jgi:hypothetical protein
MPTPFDFTVRRNPFDWFFAVTVAFGITAPVWSATVPLKLAVIVCATSGLCPMPARTKIKRPRLTQVDVALLDHGLKIIPASIQLFCPQRALALRRFLDDSISAVSLPNQEENVFEQMFIARMNEGCQARPRPAQSINALPS